MAFALEDPDFASTHRLAQPPDVVNRNPSISASVVDDHGSVNVNIAEANRLPTLQADQQVNRWVRIGRRQLPDLVGESVVVVALTFTVLCA